MMKPIAVLGLVGLALAVATNSPAGVDPDLKCQAGKYKAAAVKTLGLTKCSSKAAGDGAATDAGCLATADSKFSKLFAKAEKKVTCAEPGDEATVGAAIDGWHALIEAALDAGSGNDKCRSDKLKVAGKAASGMLKGIAKETIKNDAVKFGKSFQKARSKLQKIFGKADSKGGCITTENGNDIEDDIHNLLEALVPSAEPACDPELLYGAEGNRLHRYDLDTIDNGPLLEDILIAGAGDERRLSLADNRDINGMICSLADGSDRFLAGEDTGQPTPPAGWGVFEADGTQVGKLTPSYPDAGPEPYGCAVDPVSGNLFTTSVGNQAGGVFNGQLIMWFAPFDHYPGAPGTYPNNELSNNSCKIATDIGTAGNVAIDALGRIYVTSARGLHVRRYSPPFPTGPDAAGGCGALDSTGAPMADTVNVDVFVANPDNVGTPTGITAAPGGNWYISSVLTGMISEYNSDGDFLRRIVEPDPDETGVPLSVGHPQQVAVDCSGNIYYADMNLVVNGGSLGPGPDGKIRRVRLDLAGNGRPPEIIKSGLSFPDGVAVFPGDLEAP
jgi:hypothetical protein